MSNNYFTFKQFTIEQERSAFKVGTDGVLLGAYANVSGVRRILDVGAGTGLIAIMLAQRSHATIVAIEPDEESYIQACQNIRLCSWSDRIKIEHTELRKFYPDDRRFDLIVSNPPFFSDSLKNPEPRKAAARHNTTLTTGDILEGVTRLLDENGLFQVIMPYVEGNIFIAEAVEFGLYCNSILKIRPLPTSGFKRLIMTFSRDRRLPSEKILTIEKGPRHEFTDEYVNLTKEFYLKF